MWHIGSKPGETILVWGSRHPPQCNLDRTLRHPATLLVPPRAIPFVLLLYFTETVMFPFIPLFVCVLAPVAVSACEGDCIVGITNAFLGNYSSPIQAVLGNIVSFTAVILCGSVPKPHCKASQISTQLIPPQSRTTTPLKYLTPFIDAYNKAAYTGLETAIFPSYFHGKCQNKDGIDPEGCPDPDCPVVCGTPGSLVHFYAKLRSIAYDETSALLANLSSSDSDSYKAVEQTVLAASGAHTGGHERRRYLGPAGMPASKRVDSVQEELPKIMKGIPNLLEKACGEGQAACSWEVAMKKYILSFP